MILSIISGILTGVAFTNPAFFLLVYFSLVPFLGALLNAQSLKRTILCSFSFSFVFLGITLWWINTLNDFAAPFATLAFLALLIYQSLIFLVFSVTVHYLKQFRYIPNTIIIPMAFVAVEFLRSLGTYGITAGGLGYSQSAFLEMIQIAKYTGVYGVSFFLVLVNYLFLTILVSPRSKFGRVVTLVVIISANFIFGNMIIQEYDARLPEDGAKIAVVQGNIPQAKKLRNRNNADYFAKYQKISLDAHVYRPAIYVWPETALNNFIEGRPIMPKLRNLAVRLNAYLLLGAPRRRADRYYNAAFVFDRKGDLTDVYEKRKLVPFGEYLPYRWLLHPLLARTKMHEADYSPGGGGSVVQLGEERAGMMICFESTFPYIARARAKAGANFLLTVTNNAWFGRTYALSQHLQSGVLRAVENGVYFVQAANTGISFVVDGVGRLQTVSSVDEDAFLIAEIKKGYPTTFYTSFGDIFVLVCAGFVILLILGYIIFKEEVDQGLPEKPFVR